VAINVQRHRLNALNQSLTAQIAYNQRPVGYKSDRQDFQRRYADDGQLIFDDSVPKARPR
jgi:hypothetical protein